MWYQKKGNKYHAISIVYNGVQFHSKKEAAYAAELDIRKKAGDIRSWERQVKISLDVNDHHIANYYCDFKITNNDGSIEFHEVKGFETEVYRLKRKILEATFLHDNPDFKYVVIK